jgi:hypothetical protein
VQRNSKALSGSGNNHDAIELNFQQKLDQVLVGGGGFIAVHEFAAHNAWSSI